MFGYSENRLPRGGRKWNWRRKIFCFSSCIELDESVKINWVYLVTLWDEDMWRENVENIEENISNFENVIWRGRYLVPVVCVSWFEYVERKKVCFGGEWYENDKIDSETESESLGVSDAVWRVNKPLSPPVRELNLHLFICNLNVFFYLNLKT